jgi:hypothetical protein
MMQDSGVFQTIPEQDPIGSPRFSYVWGGNLAVFSSHEVIISPYMEILKFPEMVVPPNHSFYFCMFQYKPCIFGVPPFTDAAKPNNIMNLSTQPPLRYIEYIL